MIRIRRISDNKKAYLPLFLLAGEHTDVAANYLDQGNLWVLEDGGRAVGECLITDRGDGIVEIRSLAVDPVFRRQGFGRALIDSVATHYAKAFSALEVITSGDAMAVTFFESCGFVRQHANESHGVDSRNQPNQKCDAQPHDSICLRRELTYGTCNCKRHASHPSATEGMRSE